MPFEVYAIVFGWIVLMGVSAFFLRDENKTIERLSRVGLVVGGAGLFGSGLYFASIFAAVLIVILPVMLVVAWWNGAF